MIRERISHRQVLALTANLRVEVIGMEVLVSPEKILLEQPVSRDSVSWPLIDSPTYFVLGAVGTQLLLHPTIWSKLLQCNW